MTRKTDGGKGDRIPGADQAAYEANYASINWNARGQTQDVALTTTGAEQPTPGDQPRELEKREDNR